MLLDLKNKIQDYRSEKDFGRDVVYIEGKFANKEDVQRTLKDVLIEFFAFYLLGSEFAKLERSFAAIFKRSSESLFHESIATLLIDFIGYFYTTVLLDELKKGFQQDYVEVEEESTVLRGRILFHKLMRVHKGMAHKLPVRYYTPSHDTLLNRVFLYVSDLLAWHTTLPIIRKNAYEIMDLLEDVKFVDILPHDFSRVTFNRLTERFKSAFDLAETLYALMLLKEGRVNIDVLKALRPFIFDTAKAYENLVGKILNATGYEVHPQEEGRIFFEGPFFILGSETSSEGNYQPINIREYPDFIVIDKKDRENVFIIDAKYKELFKPSRDYISDIRQIKSYLDNKRILEKVKELKGLKIGSLPKAGFLVYFYYSEASDAKAHISSYKESSIAYWIRRDDKRIVVASINLKNLSITSKIQILRNPSTQ